MDPTLQRLDALIWRCIAVYAAVVLAAGALSFELAVSSFIKPITAAVALSLAAAYYNTRRNDPKLASALSAPAQLITFSAFAAPMSYLAASAALPAYDEAFASVDRAMGLDWPALSHWMKRHPLIDRVLAGAYASLTVQMAVVGIALAFAGQLLRLRIFVIAFAIAATVTIFLSGLVPAEGVGKIYGLHSVDRPPPVAFELLKPEFQVLSELRSGQLRELRASGAEGIISFPSLHAALAVLLALAVWRVPVVGWLGLGLNVLMLASVPIQGSHYFIDMIAGSLLGLASWAWARAIAQKPARNIETVTLQAGRT